MSMFNAHENRIRKTRLVLSFPIRDHNMDQVMLDVAIEKTQYNTGMAFLAVSAEGFFFTLTVSGYGWSKEMFDAVRLALEELYQQECIDWVFGNAPEKQVPITSAYFSDPIPFDD